MLHTFTWSTYFPYYDTSQSQDRTVKWSHQSATTLTFYWSHVWFGTWSDFQDKWSFSLLKERFDIKDWIENILCIILITVDSPRWNSTRHWQVILYSWWIIWCAHSGALLQMGWIVLSSAVKTWSVSNVEPALRFLKETPSKSVEEESDTEAGQPRDCQPVIFHYWQGLWRWGIR